MAFKPTYHERNLANLQKLGDKTKAVALKWYEYLIANGIDVLIYETIRTVEQQREYVRKGVSKTMKSYHLVGQALDFVPVKDGKADWNGYDEPAIKKAIAKAKELGFSWGGDWKTFKDKPHLQYDKIPYGSDTFTGKETPSTTLLKRGSKGIEVVKLQSKLNLFGYKLAVDGIFGTKTEQAVRDFQKKHGLAVDGIVGKQTFSKINGKLPLLKRGSKGEAIKELQKILNKLGYKLVVDGIFGVNTEKAVRNFQAKNGLAVDGIVGKHTYAKLYAKLKA
jgi:peptidoglycan LD-endopeptidase CwlK